MNVIINKEDKKVIWINGDKNKLSPTEILGSFDPNTMQAVHCPGYKPTIHEVFKPTIAGDTILEFQPKTVWNKTTLTSRQLTSWNDEIQETETTKEPIKDEIYQTFENGKWLVDETTKELETKKARYRELQSLLNSSDWRMTVDKFNSMSLEQQTYWTDLRETWREEIRTLESITGIK